MTDEPGYGLQGTERAMRAHLEHLDVDLNAAVTVSSIYRAANAVRTHATNEVLRPHGLTWTGFVVMWVVWIWDGMETRHAAEAASISKGTLTGVVGTLQARGLIERRPSAEDRRLVELHLTEQGLALIEEVFPAFNAIESSVVSNLGEGDQQGLVTSLRSIVKAIEDSQAEE